MKGVDVTILSRRRLLTISAAAAAAAIVPRPAAARGVGSDTIPQWIERSAHPVRAVEPSMPDDDLRPLLPIVGGATIVGLGEAAHTTDTLLKAKHRIARLLIEHRGFRTIAWEEAWASGVLIDRYVTWGDGDPAEIAGQAAYNLQSMALLELMEWVRDFNVDRPLRDRVRFLGADVLQLRQVQFDELDRFVREAAPSHLATLHRHLDPLRLQDSPGAQIPWYQSLKRRRQLELIDHAAEVARLVRGLPGHSSSVARFDAYMHAYTLLGFYEAYGPRGDRDDLRDRYIVAVLERWQRQMRSRIVYSAANAHTIAVASQTVSFPDPFLPPEEWATRRSLAGGLLRRRFGRRYASVGTSFNHGTILSGWQIGDVRQHAVPAPPADFVDHTLGSAGISDYLLDLRGPVPAEVDRWLDARGKHRIYGGAYYDVAIDPSYFIAANPWGAGYDAVIHLRRVDAMRPLSSA